VIRASVLAVLLATPVAAEEWQPLTGPQIRDALAARVLGYPGDRHQNFFADGRTLYEGTQSDWGQWRVEGDRYCSLWPPSDRWTCYAVERAARGLDLRFLADDGSVTVGRYIDLQ
jgi:hypothetical protein